MALYYPKLNIWDLDVDIRSTQFVQTLEDVRTWQNLHHTVKSIIWVSGFSLNIKIKIVTFIFRVYVSYLDSVSVFRVNEQSGVCVPRETES